MATWTKDKYTNEWLIRVPFYDGQEQPQTGDVVTVTRRDGNEKEIELGELKVRLEGVGLFRVAKNDAKTGKGRERPPIEKPGVFEKDGTTYIVKWNGAKTGLYALELIELRSTQGDRQRDDGETARYETEYRPGVVYSLSEKDRMPLERGKELTLRYGRCIACGAHLRVKESLEAGMGPVCRTKFA